MKKLLIILIIGSTAIASCKKSDPYSGLTQEEKNIKILQDNNWYSQVSELRWDFRPDGKLYATSLAISQGCYVTEISDYEIDYSTIVFGNDTSNKFTLNADGSLTIKKNNVVIITFVKDTYQETDFSYCP